MRKTVNRDWRASNQETKGEMMKIYNVLNLGAGVQSSTLALMAVKGEIEKPDYAIFADTKWEPNQVYKWFKWLRPILEDAGIKVEVVENGDISKTPENMQSGERWASLPYFIESNERKRSISRRQCTSEYKIVPIERFIKRSIFKLKKGQRVPFKEIHLRQWFGISLDEITRMKVFQEKWRTAVYPLIDMRMKRSDCVAWCQRNGFPIPPRSACIGCPFHSDEEWRNLRDNHPEEFESACKFDEKLRIVTKGKLRGQPYLHRSCIPLRDAPIDYYDKDQLELFDEDCTGYCGN